MGSICAASDGDNLPKDYPGDESQEVQDHGMHARINMGEVGGACVHETGDSKKSNI